MHFVAYALAAVAIAVMAFNVYLAVKVRRAILGGEVGTKWSMLTGLLAFFFVGYLFSPLAIYFGLPAQYLFALVFAVFLFGAVFVAIVIGIVRDMLVFLKVTR